jgi:hypothetical protein
VAGTIWLTLKIRVCDLTGAVAFRGNEIAG